jgi:hypothetical protein
MARLDVSNGRLVHVHEGAAALARIEVLRSIAGRGVPEVVSYNARPSPALVTTVLPPISLDRLTPTQAAALVASVAEVFARAHAAGVAHGPLRPEHLQGGPDNPVVDGWTSGAPGSPDDDVAELGRLLERLARGDSGLRAAAQRAQAADRPTAAGLAAAIRATSAPSLPGRRLSPRVLAGAAAAGVLALLVVGVSASADPARSETAPPPTTTRASRVVERDGQRLVIGKPGDVVVTGRFTCGEELPALLRPSTGEVWVFSSWAAGRGRSLDTVTGATALGVRRDGSCDRLEVRDGQGRWRAVG